MKKILVSVISVGILFCVLALPVFSAERLYSINLYPVISGSQPVEMVLLDECNRKARVLTNHNGIVQETVLGMRQIKFEYDVGIVRPYIKQDEFHETRRLPGWNLSDGRYVAEGFYDHVVFIKDKKQFEVVVKKSCISQ